jgi:hypothetical protein
MKNAISLSENRDFKGVWIPAELYLNTDLTLTEKFILVEIDSFSKHGECIASNQHFADFLGISANRVKHIIPDLVKRGYISSTLTYRPNSKCIEKRVLRVISFTPSAKNSTTPSATNDTTPSAKNSTDKNTYISNTDRSIVKYRDTYEYQNNKDLLSISIKQSMVSPQTTQKGWFEYLDISNNAMLISELDKIQYFQKDDPKYDYLYTVFSTFADEFIKHRGYKHKEISCIDLNKMSTKLSSFVQKEYIPETDEYVVKNPRKFSIYEYEKEDLVWMVKDYFEYQFDDCDYSLWHFTSDSVLSARFWRMENRCTESVI